MINISIRYLASAITVLAAIALGGCTGFESASKPESKMAIDAGSNMEAASADAPVHNAEAAFLLYQSARTPAEKRKWICIAANHDLAKAQTELARLYWPAPHRQFSPFCRDRNRAYAWALIAIRNGEAVDHMEQRMGSAMTEAERWEATKMAAFWTPNPDQCERMEQDMSCEALADAGSLIPR